MKSKFLHKVISLVVCLSFVSMLATPYLAKAQASTVASTDSITNLLQAHELLSMIPSQAMAKKVFVESQKALQDAPTQNAQTQLLQEKNEKLAKALDLSQKFQECSGNTDIAPSALSALLNHEDANPCRLRTTEGVERTGIEKLSQNLSDIQQYVTLQEAVSTLADQTIHDMTQNYQAYKEKYEQTSPAKPEVSKNRKQLLSELQSSVDRIKASLILPDYYDRMASFSELDPSLTPLLTRGGYEDLTPENMAPVIEDGLESLNMINELQIASRTLVSQNNSEGQSLLDLQSSFRAPADEMFSKLGGSFEDYLRTIQTAPTYALRGQTNPDLKFLTPGFLPELYHPSTASQFLSNQKITFQKRRAPIELKLSEISKNPLLFTKPLRNFINNLDDRPTQPIQLTQNDIDAALKDQQSTIERQIGELGSLKQKNPSKAFKELLKQDPVRIWKYTFNHPEMLAHVCNAYHQIKDEQASEKNWDRIYFWGGMGVGTLALLTGVGAIGTLGGYSMIAAAGMGAGSGVLITQHEVSRAMDANYNYQQMYAYVVADMGGNQKAALEELEKYNSHVFNGVLTGAFSAVDAAGLYVGLRGLTQIRKAGSTITEASALVTERSVSSVTKTAATKTATLRQIDLLSEATENPELKIFLTKVLDGSTIPEHIRPHAQSFLTEALKEAGDSSYETLTKIEKLKKAMKPFPEFQADLNKALVELKPTEVVENIVGRPIRKPVTNAEFRVPREVHYSEFGTPEFKQAYFQHKAWIANATMDTTEMRTMNEGFSRILNNIPTIKKASEIETALSAIRGQDPNEWKALLKYAASADEARLHSIIKQLPEQAFPPNYVPGSASAWHHLGDGVGEMPLDSTPGFVTMENGGHYHFYTKMNPTDPGHVDVFSVHYTPAEGQAALVFPKAKVGQPLPRILTGSGHAEIARGVFKTPEDLKTVNRLQAALDTYYAKLVRTVNSLGGVSNPENKDGVLASYKILNSGKFNNGSASLAQQVSDDSFKIIQGEASSMIESPEAAKLAIKKLEHASEVIDQLEEAAAQTSAH